MTVTMKEIEAARERLKSVILPTPMIADGRLGREIGVKAHLKAESLQIGGSFKIRGAFNKISQLTDQEKKRGEAWAWILNSAFMDHEPVFVMFNPATRYIVDFHCPHRSRIGAITPVGERILELVLGEAPVMMKTCLIS